MSMGMGSGEGPRTWMLWNMGVCEVLEQGSPKVVALTALLQKLLQRTQTGAKWGHQRPPYLWRGASIQIWRDRC
jgi:hypothetical protein